MDRSSTKIDARINTLPTGQILIVPLNEGAEENVASYISPLTGRSTRTWFPEHFYKCLPLTIANTTGFTFNAPCDIDIEWNGDQSASGLQYWPRNHIPTGCELLSHFGAGILTVGISYSIITPPGVNVYVGPPPNMFIDGLNFMTAIVETDNLRHDFTFNIKVTRVGERLTIPKDFPLGYFLPLPRTDNSELVSDPDHPMMAREQLAFQSYYKIRTGKLNKNYMFGKDHLGYAFHNHKRKVK